MKVEVKIHQDVRGKELKYLVIEGAGETVAINIGDKNYDALEKMQNAEMHGYTVKELDELDKLAEEEYKKPLDNEQQEKDLADFAKSQGLIEDEKKGGW